MLKEIKELRKELYDYNFRDHPYVLKWKWFYYRKMKAVVYVEMSAWIAYFCIKLRINPNSITITYVLLGIAGGIFLSIATKATVVIAAIIFFFRPFLDWVDGAVARRINKKTITGHILDSYGVVVGWIFQLTGLSIYVAVKSGWDIYYYIAVLIPIISRIDIKQYIKLKYMDIYIMDKSIIEKKIGEDASIKNHSGSGIAETKSNLQSKVRNALLMITQCNARNVDLICLLLLIEVFSSVFVSWIVVLCYVFIELLRYFYSFFLLTKRNSAGDLYKYIYNKMKQTH